MNNTQPLPDSSSPKGGLKIRVFGIGHAGLYVLDQLASPEIPQSFFTAVDVDSETLGKAITADKILLGTGMYKGLGTGGDPERGRALAEEHIERVRTLCHEQDVVFLVAGLGGGVGSGVTPLLARAAKEAGALVLAFVLIPFTCEGTRRQKFARESLAELKQIADGVICLPNQQVFKLVDERTTLLDTFRMTNGLLAEAVRGVWRLLMHKGLIEIHFSDLAAVLRGSQSESSFAVAEASGANRVDSVIRKLFTHPLLVESDASGPTSAALISLIAGRDLTMAEVNHVMAEVSGRYPGAQIIMGAAVSDDFKDRLSVTLLVSHQTSVETERSNQVTQEPARPPVLAASPRLAHDLSTTTPVITPDRLSFNRSAVRPEGKSRRSSVKMLQAQLPLDTVPKGRFEKSEPTLHKGEDLDVPTYVRRGMALN